MSGIQVKSPFFNVSVESGMSSQNMICLYRSMNRNFRNPLIDRAGGTVALLKVIADVDEGGRKIEWDELEIDICEVAFYILCEHGYVLELDEYLGAGGNGEYIVAALFIHDRQGDGRYDAISAVGISGGIFAGVVDNAYPAVVYLSKRVAKGGVEVKACEFSVGAKDF